MAQQTTATDDVPTATEFIPADENDGIGSGGFVLRHLQATGDKGTEVVSTEPAGDEFRNHVFVCDECGHDETIESDMGHHLHFAHFVRDD